MKQTIVLCIALVGVASPASSEMPLWGYFDRFWGALEKTCGLAIQSPQGFVDTSAARVSLGWPLWMRTPDNSNFAVFQEVDNVSFVVSFASLPNVMQTTCESGELEEASGGAFLNVEPAEVARQLTAWMDAKSNFAYAGGQLLVQESPSSTPVGDQEYDYVVSSTVGGQQVIYTVGIYGAGLDLYLTHETRP